MTIFVSDAGEIAALNAVLALINGGSGSPSNFEVLNGATSLAVLPFGNQTTAFASATTATDKASATTNAAFTNSGTPVGNTTINAGRFRDKSNNVVMSFSISAAAGGGDMTVTDPSIPSNATAVSCSGVTVTLNITN